jgi:hypothetical protein
MGDFFNVWKTLNSKLVMGLAGVPFSLGVNMVGK